MGMFDWLKLKLGAGTDEPHPAWVEASEHVRRLATVIDLDWQAQAEPSGPCMYGRRDGLRFILRKGGFVSTDANDPVPTDWRGYVRGRNGFGTATSRAVDPMDLLPEMLDIAWRIVRNQQRRDEEFALSLQVAAEHLDATSEDDVRIGEWCDCGMQASSMEATMEGLAWWCEHCGLRWPVETPPS